MPRAVLHITALAWIASRRSSRTLGNALGVNRSARLTAVNTKEHQVLNEHLDAQSHKVHRLDAHTVVKNDVSVFLDGCLDVCRERNAAISCARM